MYSILMIFLLMPCTYVILLDAAKVIKWPDEVIEHELEVPEAPLEDNIVTEFTNNAEPSEERPTASKLEKSYPPCLTDFIDSLIYDLMQNENGRIIVSAFLNAFTRTTSNSISSNMYLHVSRQFKNLLKDPKGSQSISVISSTVTKVLTDERALTKVNTAVESIKMTFVQPETTLYVENISELVTSLTGRPKSRRIFRALGDGLLSLFKLSDPKNVIIKGFEDLRTYTWPGAASQHAVIG